MKKDLEGYHPVEFWREWNGFMSICKILDRDCDSRLKLGERIDAREYAAFISSLERKLTKVKEFNIRKIK